MRADSATYMFRSIEAMNGYFEEWYPEQTYFCVDDEGQRYRFFPDRGGVETRPEGPPGAWTEVFERAMINSLRKLSPGLQKELGIVDPAQLDAAFLHALLDDPVRQQFLSD